MSERALYVQKLKVSRRPSDLDVEESDPYGSIRAVGNDTQGKYVTDVKVTLTGGYASWPDSSIWHEVRAMYERCR